MSRPTLRAWGFLKLFYSGRERITDWRMRSENTMYIHGITFFRFGERALIGPHEKKGGGVRVWGCCCCCYRRANGTLAEATAGRPWWAPSDSVWKGRTQYLQCGRLCYILIGRHETIVKVGFLKETPMRSFCLVTDVFVDSVFIEVILIFRPLVMTRMEAAEEGSACIRKEPQAHSPRPIRTFFSLPECTYSWLKSIFAKSFVPIQIFVIPLMDRVGETSLKRAKCVLQVVCQVFNVVVQLPFVRLCRRVVRQIMRARCWIRFWRRIRVWRRRSSLISGLMRGNIERCFWAP